MEQRFRDALEDTMNSQCEEVVRRNSRSGSEMDRVPAGTSQPRARGARPGAGRRYERFESITVRAAARVLQVQRDGDITAQEAEFYLRELAAMDAHASWDAF